MLIIKERFFTAALYYQLSVSLFEIRCINSLFSLLSWMFEFTNLTVLPPTGKQDLFFNCNFFSLQFSRSVVSDSLWPHESQHARPPCPSPTPGVHSDSRPLSQWCHPAISSWVVPFSSCPQSLPASVFSNESTLRMRCLKYWSFSFTGRNINNCRYADDTTLMAESEEELKSLDESERGEWKSWLKAQHSEN